MTTIAQGNLEGATARSNVTTSLLSKTASMGCRSP